MIAPVPVLIDPTIGEPIYRGPMDESINDEQHGHDEAERAKRSKETAAAARINNQSQWVEQQLRIAQERGDFDNLPGAGKPLEGLGAEHDPDWWLKKLVEREHISVLPPALALRTEDLELGDRLDRMSTESEVRRELEEFNARVRGARMQLEGGPPVITPEREADAEVAAWLGRRDARLAAQRAALKAKDEQGQEPRKGWLRRRPR